MPPPRTSIAVFEDISTAPNVTRTEKKQRQVQNSNSVTCQRLQNSLPTELPDHRVLRDFRRMCKAQQASNVSQTADYTKTESITSQPEMTYFPTRPVYLRFPQSSINIDLLKPRWMSFLVHSMFVIKWKFMSINEEYVFGNILNTF